MIPSQEKEGAQVTYKTTVHEGAAAQQIHVVGKQQDTTLICAADSGLPLSMKIVAMLPGTSAPAVASAAFDYPSTGPADIYDLGVPADAEVIDNRPTGNAADLAEQVQSHFDAGFEDHIAVMLESDVGPNDVLEPNRIVVMWQQGPLKRMSCYDVYNTRGRNGTLARYPRFKDVWSDLTIADVLGLLSDDIADYQVVSHTDPDHQLLPRS